MLVERFQRFLDKYRRYGMLDSEACTRYQFAEAVYTLYVLQIKGFSYIHF